MPMRLRDLGEFGLIDLIRKKTQTPRVRGVHLGIGDDAAHVSTPGDSLLFTSDLLIEGVHFNRDWISMRDLGHKSLTVSLSDIAAMGGRPAYFLLSLALPDLATQTAAALVRGIHAAAAEHGATLVGGDTCAADRVIIDVFLAGFAPYGAVTRAGARAGDDIYVTGTLGDSALGLTLLSEPRPGDLATDLALSEPGIGDSATDRAPLSEPRNTVSARDRDSDTLGDSATGRALLSEPPRGDSGTGRAPLSETRSRVSARDRNYLVRRHHRPTARVTTGMELARQGLARAMMDVSDGLTQDLGHICRASGTGAVVYQDRVPLSPVFRRVAGPGDLACALSGGEDYELLFTARSDARKAVERVARRTGVAITRIGECVPRRHGLMLVDPRGERAPLTAPGYDHFKERADGKKANRSS